MECSTYLLCLMSIVMLLLWSINADHICSGTFQQDCVCQMSTVGGGINVHFSQPLSNHFIKLRNFINIGLKTLVVE